MVMGMVVRNRMGKKEKKGASSSTAAPPVVKDEDPDGKVLLNKDALEEAKKYTSTLVMNAPTRFSTWICQYDVSIRRGKFMMALQALFKARALDPTSSELFVRILDLQQKQFSTSDSMASSASVLQEVFESERCKLLQWNNSFSVNNTTLSDFVSNVAASIKNDKRASLALRIAVAKAMVSCEIGTAADAVSIITVEKLQIYGVTLEGCKDALSYLKELCGDADDAMGASIQEWKDLIEQYYPMANWDK